MLSRLHFGVKRLITINRDGQSDLGVGHVVYTREEAEEEGIVFKPWKEADLGGWALTDDGFVGKVLKKKVYKGRDYFVFAFTRIFSSKNTRLEFAKCKSYSAIGGKSWVERESARRRGRDTIKLMAKMVLSGKVDYALLGQAYRPKQGIPEATVRRFLKKEEVKKLVDKAIDEELTRVGITSNWVLDVIKKAILLAEVNEDPGNMLKGAIEAAKIRDMYPKDNKTTAVVEYNISNELLERISSEKVDTPADLLEAANKDKALDIESTITSME